MEVNEKIELEIMDMGTEGEGIGHGEGIAVFVPGAITGDKVLVEITALKKNFARGKIVDLLEASPDRVKPPCRYAGTCGGCSLQAMEYGAQLRLKQKWIYDRLCRIGGLTEPLVHETFGMEAPYRYRNKAQFPINAGQMAKNKEGKYRNNKACSVGFYQVKSHEVVNCEKCLIQARPAEVLAQVVRKFVTTMGISVYDEKNSMGLLRHLIVKSAFETGEVMAILVVNGDHLPKIKILVEMMDEAIAKISDEDQNEINWSLESVILNVNKGKSSLIMGKECINIAGKPTLMDSVGDLSFEISPQSFYQVNPVQMKKLYETVVNYAGLTGEETILDLYCGVGSIGLYCASKAKKIIGIESVKSSVLDANRNAVVNGIVNAEYVYGRAEEVLPKRFSGIHADIVILDPPRVGCDKALLDAVLEISPKKIIYVSCDPATLARDIKLLQDASYQFVEAQPVDMFPHTGHVECVVLMSRQNP